jgi:hypothetical protein
MFPHPNLFQNVHIPGNSDIVAFALRSNTKNIEIFATVVNSQCDTKRKINPKAY